MNPFDLPGPQFLLFYALAAAFVLCLLYLIGQLWEGGGAPRMDLADPYLIACLRGGEDELLRVALVSLVDRGLLTASGSKVVRAGNAAPGLVRREIDRALMEKFVTPGEAASVFYDPALKAACEPYNETLRRGGLLPDEAVTLRRTMIFTAAFLVLAGLGGIKLYVAFQRGRTNVLFLIILMVFAIWLAYKVTFRRLTARGRNVLADVQALYLGLRARASLIRPGGATVEALMLASAFGLGALAGGGAFGFTQQLFPQPKKQQTSGWGGDGGSSCGSSGGSSCGSSCGGGGCGGGCGGCGG